MTSQTVGGVRSPVRYSLAWLLALLAAVPLVGASWLASTTIRTAGNERDGATVINANVAELVSLTELRTSLLDERNWDSQLRGIEELGLDPELASALLGIDLVADLDAAKNDVDARLAEMELLAVAAEIDAIREVRRDVDPALVGDRYAVVEARLANRSDVIVDDLITLAGTLSNADRLVTTLRVVRSAMLARRASAEEYPAYFGARFSPVQRNVDELQLLTEQHALRLQAEADIERMAVADAEAGDALRAIADNESAALFDSAIEDLIEQGGASSERSVDSSLALALGDIEGLAAELDASNETNALYLDLVEAAAADAVAASEDLGALATARENRAVLGITVLAVASLFVVFAARQAIRHPVRRLRIVAEQLSAGKGGVRFGRGGGSVEIRAAGAALDEAADHIELAERQANALAEGDLDHPVLTSPTSGRLGASLQRAVSALAASIQEREDLRRRVTYEATHDGLTGLANRTESIRLLGHALGRVRRSDHGLAVLYVDLDGFKAVNDTYGHRAGDLLLCTVARRMAACIRDGDHLGRLGGDEFVVIAEPVRAVDDAVDLAGRLLASLGNPIEIDDAVVRVGASIGISYTIDGNLDGEGRSESELLRDADLAVYAAKARGRGRIELCDDRLRASSFERAELERRLKAALDDDQFVLHYQPIVDPHGRLQSLEALIRWDQPGVGLVDPDQFLPVAESSDLMVRIDRWVLANAAAQMSRWDAEGSAMAGVTVNVNVSGRSLDAGSFVADVLTPLEQSGIDPSRIVIEITERALLKDLEGAVHKLELLRSRGVRTAIDDFGTGYTSLAHLRTLPVDVLKIDRSFVADETARPLVKLIIDTGHLLGATITAEGVETTGQATAMHELGSDDLQGFLFGSPRSPADLEHLESERAG